MTPCCQKCGAELGPNRQWWSLYFVDTLRGEETPGPTYCDACVKAWAEDGADSSTLESFDGLSSVKIAALDQARQHVAATGSADDVVDLARRFEAYLVE